MWVRSLPWTTQHRARIYFTPRTSGSPSWARGVSEIFSALSLRLNDLSADKDIDDVYQAGNDELVDYLGSGTGECRIACSMPGEPYTPCGYVIFRLRREKLK